MEVTDDRQSRWARGEVSRVGGRFSEKEIFE